MQSQARALSSQRQEPTSRSGPLADHTAGGRLSEHTSRQPESAQTAPGPLQAGQGPQGLRQPQSGHFQAGQQLVDQWSQPWMRKLAGLNAAQAADQPVVDSASPIKAQHAQQPQQPQHAQHAKQAQQQQSHDLGKSAQAETPDGGEDEGLAQLQSAFSSDSKSSAPLTAVQQAQQWILQQQLLQQHKQQQQRQLSRPSSVSPSVPGTDQDSDVGNKQSHKPTAAASVPPLTSTSAHTSAEPPRQMLEMPRNITNVIMGAQRRTMAHLAPQDPKRPSWGQLGDQAPGQGTSSLPRVSGPLPGSDPKIPNWNLAGNGSAAPTSSSAGLAQPLGMFQMPLPATDPNPSSKLPSATASQAQDTSPKQAQPQALLNALRLQPQPQPGNLPSLAPFSFLQSQAWSPATRGGPQSQGMPGTLVSQSELPHTSRQSSPRQPHFPVPPPSWPQQPQAGARTITVQRKGAKDVMDIQRLLQQQNAAAQKAWSGPGSDEQEKNLGLDSDASPTQTT